MKVKPSVKKICDKCKVTGLTHDRLHLAVLRATHVIRTYALPVQALADDTSGGGRGTGRTTATPTLRAGLGSAPGSGGAEDPRHNNWSH